MINFTVIIPHKNIPQLLERLVSSIPERDDLEIIVVDDGSSTATVDFAHFPCSDRTDLKLIRNEESRGAGHARNCALKKAKEHNADVVGCDFTDEYADRQTVRHQPYVDDMQENMRRLLDGRLFPSLWSTLVRRELISRNDITFADGLNMGEDLLFLVKVYAHAQRLASTTQAFYHYRHSPTSLCATKSHTGVDTDILIAGQIESYLQHQGLLHLYQAEVAYRKFFSKLPLVAGFHDKATYKEWLAIYPETHRHICKYRRLDLKQRVELCLAARGCWLLPRAMSGFLKWQHSLRERKTKK